MQSAAYIRVSAHAEDFATQWAAIERAATARGDTIALWYAEKRSALTTARDELTRLRGHARAGVVPRLYVVRLDRLTRSGIGDTFDLVEELRAYGVDIVSIADGFSLSGPASDVVLAVMAWAAKMEKRLATADSVAVARAERNGGSGFPAHGPTRSRSYD